MKRARTVGFIFACLLWATVVTAADETPAPEADTSGHSHGVDPLAPLFDVHQWTVVQSAYAKFGADHQNVLVQLLKSIAPTGADGIGRRLYSVNLIVVEQGRLLYSFASLAVPPLDSRRMDEVFYMDDRNVKAGGPLELRDVTGDEVPEIIFHSGWAPADNSITQIHVLQYVGNAPTKFRDIRAKAFTESWWTRFRWLDLVGHTVAIVAEPMDPSAEPGAASHSSPKFHVYRVYRWDPTNETFMLSETIPSTGKLHNDDEDPLQTDWAYIVAKLKKR